MKKLGFALSIIAALVLSITSCQKTDENKAPEMVEVYLDSAFPADDLLKKTDDNGSEEEYTYCKKIFYTMTKAYVQYDIVDDNDYENHNYELPPKYEAHLEVFATQIDGKWVIKSKDPILLPAGKWLCIRTFHVSAGDAFPAMAIPLKGSLFEGFVEYPLPYYHYVEKNVRKDYINLQILCINPENEPDFGFRYFELDVVQTMAFCVLGNICDEDGWHREAPFKLKVWKFNDCADPTGGEEPILSIKNFDASDEGQRPLGGNIFDEEGDALLCTYLPDTHDDDCFWMEIWVYDPESPWANERGYYMVECGVICEDEIKAKWASKPLPNGAPTNFFHFQVSHSINCTPMKRFLLDDCCENRLYYSNINIPNSGQGTIFGIFKLVYDETPMLVQSMNLNHPQGAANDTHIAYNADNKVLYAVSDNEVYMFQNDVYKQKLDYTSIADVGSGVPQAVYANLDGRKLLYVGDAGNNQIYVVSVNDDGIPVGPLYQTFSDGSFDGGDLIVGIDDRGYFLRQFNNSGTQITTYRLDNDGKYTGVKTTAQENPSLAVTGSAVLLNTTYLSVTGTGIVKTDGSGNLIAPGRRQQFEWGDLASCSLLDERTNGQP